MCASILVTSSDYLENCKKTLVEENVTLKGGIGAGTFRILGKVMSMESCIELCCKTSTCDVAFLSASKCYGVECVSDEECKSTATDTSDVRVLIAHVRTGHKKGQCWNGREINFFVGLTHRLRASSSLNRNSKMNSEACFTRNGVLHTDVLHKPRLEVENFLWIKHISRCLFPRIISQDSLRLHVCDACEI